jgi:hypothetical protein
MDRLSKARRIDTTLSRPVPKINILSARRSTSTLRITGAALTSRGVNKKTRHKSAIARIRRASFTRQVISHPLESFSLGIIQWEPSNASVGLSPRAERLF